MYHYSWVINIYPSAAPHRPTGVCAVTEYREERARTHVQASLCPPQCVWIRKDSKIGWKRICFPCEFIDRDTFFKKLVDRESANPETYLFARALCPTNIAEFSPTGFRPLALFLWPSVTVSFSFSSSLLFVPFLLRRCYVFFLLSSHSLVTMGKQTLVVQHAQWSYGWDF